MEVQRGGGVGNMVRRPHLLLRFAPFIFHPVFCVLM
jgi:hypothetical protein